MEFKREQAEWVAGLVMRRYEFGGVIEWNDVREVCNEQTKREFTSSDLNQLTEFIVGRLPRDFVDRGARRSKETSRKPSSRSR